MIKIFELFKLVAIVMSSILQVVQSNNSEIVELIGRLAEVENSQVTLILDNNKSNLHLLFNQNKVEAFFEVSELLKMEQDRKAKTACPVFQSYSQQNDTLEILHRRSNVIAEGKRNRMLIFWVNSSNIQHGLSILQLSILRCKQYIHPGYLKQNTRILFITENPNDTLRVFDNHWIQRHSRSAVFQKINNKIALFRNHEFKTMIYYFSEKDVLRKTFELPTSYENVVVRVLCYIYAYTISTDPTVGNSHGIAKFGDYWGFEIEILHHIKEALKFDVTIDSPEPEDWGSIDGENGNWTGALGRVMRDEADIFLGCPFSHNIYQIINPTQFYDVDYFGWVAPPIKTISSYTSFLTPLDNLVWLLTAISSIIFGILLYYVALFEHEITKSKHSNFWSHPFAAWCYCFGVLVGEFIIPLIQIRSNKLPSVRLLICTWSIGCLIISQSYAGNLKAHLMKPTLGKPIDSVKSIHESGLDIDIVDIGLEANQLMKTSTDPVLSQIQNKSKAIDPYPLDLASVYDGKLIIMEWYLSLKNEVLKHYMNPKTSQSILYISPEPVFDKKWITFGMNKMSHYNEQFSQLTQRALDFGLIDTWRQRAIRQQIANARSSDEPQLKWNEAGPSRRLNLKDAQGIILLYPIMVAMLGAIAVIEWTAGWSNSEIKANIVQ